VRCRINDGCLSDDRYGDSGCEDLAEEDDVDGEVGSSGLGAEGDAGGRRW